MDSSSKKVKLVIGEDRISSLPDEVLIHILSLLSTRDVFRTSVLSSRWEKLWASVPNLSFRSSDGRTQGLTREALNSAYMNFIDRILLLHHSSIHQFHLNCSPQIDKSRVNAWISTVVERNVRNIIISDFYSTKLRLPISLFTCKTLEFLKLDGGLQFSVPSSVYFPRLKILHVVLTTPSEKLTEKLFCSSPMLEDLKLEVENDSGKSKYNISSPALKKLSLYVNTDQLEDYNSVVTIDAPVLEVLEIFDDCYMRYNFKNLYSLRTACVDIDIIGHSHGNLQRVGELYKLLIAISNVKNVSLGPCTMCTIANAVELEWPVLPNITHLQLEIPEFFEANNFSRWPKFPNVRHLLLNVEDFGFRDLLNILKLVPNLASLIYKRVPYARSMDESDPSEEQRVPTCLLSCLRNIELREVEGLETELKLVKYLLESAQVLEMLTIENREFREVPQEKFQAEIIGMCRSSTSSQVVFV